MKLELIDADPRKSRIVLTEFPVIVGIDRNGKVYLDDSWLGHYQCMIDCSDGALMVWDLGTKLGTSVNGVRITQKTPLESGDELRVGPTHFHVHYDDGQARPPRSAEQPLADSRPDRERSTGRRQPAVSA
jgi:pilus assembly protein CpaF